MDLARCFKSPLSLRFCSSYQSCSIVRHQELGVIAPSRCSKSSPPALQILHGEPQSLQVIIAHSLTREVFRQGLPTQPLATLADRDDGQEPAHGGPVPHERVHWHDPRQGRRQDEPDVGAGPAHVPGPRAGP